LYNWNPVGAEHGSRSSTHPYWGATAGIAAVIGGYLLSLWALTGRRMCPYHEPSVPAVGSWAWLLIVLLVTIFGMLCFRRGGSLWPASLGWVS
jgi:hypothetical protein